MSWLTKSLSLRLTTPSFNSFSAPHTSFACIVHTALILSPDPNCVSALAVYRVFVCLYRYLCLVLGVCAVPPVVLLCLVSSLFYGASPSSGGSSPWYHGS